MPSDSVNLVAALGGELITYTPYNGVAKQFKAVVERRPTQVQQAGGFSYGANTIELTIPKDAVHGVVMIQARKDRVRFKKSLADREETDFTVNTLLREDEGLVASDGGMFHVLVQA